MVTNFSTTSDYEAWGDIDGTRFCCESDPQDRPTRFVIIGSAGADTLRFHLGSSYNLFPLAGPTDAEIYAGGGNDLVEGSYDTTVNYGVEWLYGEGGDDNIVGEPGDDLIHGGDGNDTCAGLDGADIVVGDAGNDSVHGDNSNDEVHGGDGNDQVTGDNHDDYLYGEVGDDTMEGFQGIDIMEGNEGNDVMHGGGENDRMYGGAGNDGMRGDGGDDYMDGGVGNDFLCGNGEATATGDWLIAGDGDPGVDILQAGISADWGDECGNNTTRWDGFAPPLDAYCLPANKIATPLTCP
jgi:Ca2+-binding RTX toxin-like protein